MAHVARLRVYPVKALDGEDRDVVGLTPNGTLAGDRAFALFGPDGDVINGKRTDAVHRLRTSYDAAGGVLRVRRAEQPPNDARAFDLTADRAAAEAWFAEHLGTPVTIRRDAERSFVDRPESGPSVVSTATLEAVASWFEALDVADVRRRLRANVEVGGVPAFWEDRFVTDDAPAFEAGRVRLEGVEPCGRCVVPTRDPDTGEPTPGFREQFVERRAATYPEWADRSAFPHDYTLMLIARVPEADRDGELRVGDPVRVVGGDARRTET
ncbi:MAG: MOSC domain-containing protein [Halobacteriales archaeon]